MDNSDGLIDAAAQEAVNDMMKDSNMSIPEPAIAIGIGNGNDLFIGKDKRLYFGVSHRDFQSTIQLTKNVTTKRDIDFIIECLQTMRVHAEP